MSGDWRSVCNVALAGMLLELVFTLLVKRLNIIAFVTRGLIGRFSTNLIISSNKLFMRKFSFLRDNSGWHRRSNHQRIHRRCACYGCLMWHIMCVDRHGFNAFVLALNKTTILRASDQILEKELNMKCLCPGDMPFAHAYRFCFTEKR